jgi:cytochrome c-type biogenesis protein CcmH
MIGRPVVLALFLLVAAPVLAATSPDERLGDPALEARARELSKELRCLVCQNQSIDDSDAPLAQDLRRIVRERLVAGDTDAEIESYLVARYGEFVLLAPPVRPGTWLLWAGPFVILALGGGTALLMALRRRRAPVEPASGLTPEERAELDGFLADDRPR